MFHVRQNQEAASGRAVMTHGESVTLTIFKVDLAPLRPVFLFPIPLYQTNLHFNQTIPQSHHPLAFRLYWHPAPRISIVWEKSCLPPPKRLCDWFIYIYTYISVALIGEETHIVKLATKHHFVNNRADRIIPKLIGSTPNVIFKRQQFQNHCVFAQGSVSSCLYVPTAAWHYGGRRRGALPATTNCTEKKTTHRFADMICSCQWFPPTVARGAQTALLVIHLCVCQVWQARLVCAELTGSNRGRAVSVCDSLSIITSCGLPRAALSSALPTGRRFKLVARRSLTHCICQCLLRTLVLFPVY